jgi:hypothetical protein
VRKFERGARRRALLRFASRSQKVEAMQSSRYIHRLIEIMAALRDPAGGLSLGPGTDIRIDRALHD